MRKIKRQSRTLDGKTAAELDQELRSPVTETNDTVDKNLGQTTDKPKTIPSFFELVGLQRKVVVKLFNHCQLNGSRETSKLSIESLVLSLGNPSSSIQKTIQRVEKKGFVSRKRFKNGRGGWTIYELPEFVYQQVLQSETQDKLRTNLGQSADKPKSEPKTEPKTSPSSSSSGNLIENQTTITKQLKKLADIEIPKNLSSIGFGATQLRQLEKLEPEFLIEPEKIQESLDAFSYDLDLGAIKARRGPLNFLMGILRGGDIYRSEELLRAQKQEQDEYFGRVRALEAELLKKKAEFENLKFNEWQNNMSDEQKLQAVPEKSFANFGGPAYNSLLKSYFLENVFEKEGLE